MIIENNVLKSISDSDLKNNILTIPNGVTQIASSALEYGKFKEVILPKTLRLISFDAFSDCEKLEHIEIPDSVFYIGSDAFLGCKSLKSVTLPISLNEISQGTFNGCTSLKNIQLPKFLKKIGLNAFENCHSLENINLPKTLETIDNGAFKNCYNLKSINLPKNLNEINVSAFLGCKSLESIEIPKNVTKISETSFFNCINLHTIKLPKDLKEIKSKAFQDCISLTEIEIPKNVELIENYAFSNCNNLKNIDLSKNNNLELQPFAFSNCSELKTVKLPETLSIIDTGVFENTHSLENIEIPESVSNIGALAFNNSGIKNINLPANLTNLDKKAFCNCANLEQIKIPDKITTINSHCFDACSNLKQVTLPKNLKRIGFYAFSYCDKLENIDIPEGTLELSESAFSYCKNLKEITLPNSITSIGGSCFTRCHKLESVHLPNNLKSIPYQLFQNCYSLEEVIIPESVKTIGHSAFFQCVNLMDINLPKNLTSIEEYAFEECNNLTKLEIPDSVEKIGRASFSNCFSLESIKLPKNLKEISENLFDSCYDLKSIEIPDSVTEIKSYAFLNCSSLSNITLPKQLKVIENKAFFACTKLKSITLPDTLEKIEDNAFDYCESLESIYIPNTIEKFKVPEKTELLFFQKEKNGFSLLSERTPSSIPLQELNINPLLLSKNWDKREIILKEQRNPIYADFYNTFISELPNQNIENFVNSHNFTFLKQFNISTYSDNNDRKYFYKVLYNLGAFSPPVQENNKTINYAQKVCEFIKQQVSLGKTSYNELSSIFFETKNEGLKKEFTEFFIKDFDKLIIEENKNPGFISKCYNDFERVQSTNTNNRGSQRQLKPTVEKFIDYFRENKFTGITNENEKIAETISPYFSDQKLFDLAVKIDSEQKSNNIPKNILSIHLSENTQKYPFENIDTYSDNIQKEAHSLIKNLEKTSIKQFSYDWLEKNDPQNFILGKLCNCCSHLDGVGYGIMRGSMIHPNIQNLVIRNSNGEIVAKSTLYINPEEEYGIFNNVEVSHKLSDSDLKLIYEKFIKGVNDFVAQYNLEHPDKPLKIMTVGMDNNDLEYEITRKHTESKYLFEPIDYADFCEKIHNQKYSGDSFDQQYIIWNSDENNLGK